LQEHQRHHIQAARCDQRRISYQVAQKTREIGIRLALGAKRAQVLSMVLKRAAVIGLSGMCMGIMLSFAANRALRAVIGAAVRRRPVFDDRAGDVADQSAGSSPCRRARESTHNRR